MNRQDRQNLAAMNASVRNGEPIGIDTTTGMPAIDSHGSFISPDGDNTVPVGNVPSITPKPGTKLAAEDDFGAMPVGDDNTVSNVPQGEIITPKPGTKLAYDQVSSGGDLMEGTPYTPMTVSDEGEDGTVPVSNEVITPKPGTKLAA